MTTTATHPQATIPAPARYGGTVSYLYAFDIAYEISRNLPTTLLGSTVAQFQIDSNKRAPRQLFFYRPRMVRLPPLERFGPNGPVRIDRQVKIFPVGAISIVFTLPFGVEHISDLAVYHDPSFSTGRSLHDEAIALAEQLHTELLPHLVRPVSRIADEEAYTVFSITTPLEMDGKHVAAEDWLDAHRRTVAAILTEERDADHLSDQEADESTSRYLSYYDHDLVVIDWDAALIVDESRYVDEMIYLMELANLQLAELEAYDRILDDVVDRAYRDLARRGGSWMSRWTGARTLRELREIRVDFSRITDELSNITKFFGDWHLARIYQALAARFHLTDWQRTNDEKLKTLDELYQLLQSDRNNRYMLVLEATIVLLFIIDLIMLFRSGH